MKKIFSVLFLILAVLVGNAQTQPMKFLGIGMNSTMSTFVSKLKGKGFVEDVSHTKPNYTVMKGTFAGAVGDKIECGELGELEVTESDDGGSILFLNKLNSFTKDTVDAWVDIL